MSVVKCDTDKSENDNVKLGNKYADEVAKYCAFASGTLNSGEQCKTKHDKVACFLSKTVQTLNELKELQDEAPEDEKKKWETPGCAKDSC